MTEREYADNDSPYAGRYVEYNTEEDPCVCGHALEFHNQQTITDGSDNCSKCKCKEFEFDEYAGEPE